MTAGPRRGQPRAELEAEYRRAKALARAAARKVAALRYLGRVSLVMAARFGKDSLPPRIPGDGLAEAISLAGEDAGFRRAIVACLRDQGKTEEEAAAWLREMGADGPVSA